MSILAHFENQDLETFVKIREKQVRFVKIESVDSLDDSESRCVIWRTWENPGASVAIR